MAKIDFKNVQTMIGVEAVVNGPIKMRGGIIVYGKVYGDIHTEGPVRITISGEVIGDIQASDAHIGGSIQGNVTVSNRIVLGRKSELKGDLIYHSLVIEDGAQFEGSCSVIGDRQDASDSLVSDARLRFTMASPSSEPNA
ncbi:MAG: polymer-forming cytoskeletal protein [Candidatus Marinimicrobia bacterium]|jgi:cytoskeletal protein CcmA (bactofilin family)|nr:polymer-forming cytoskeletal protein [Candidatus Neomarinimicrobiota bacterium]|tara:strand:+ start:35 stop:454 length:420 start_codon:yes stop_codon:yes gene_type:complete